MPRLIGQIFLAVLRAHQFARRLDRHAGQIGRVGTHISNVPVLVQALRHLHRPPGREAELAVGFLLQRAGCERRVGLGRVWLIFQRSHFELAVLQARGQVGRGLFVHLQECGVFELAGGRVEILARRNAAPVDRDQLGAELLLVSLGKAADQVPIGGRTEGHPQSLALDDQPHGHALHPAGRQLGPHFAPQQRRNFVAVQPVDNPPRFLSFDQVAVDLPRMLERFLDGLFGDFVKHQPMDRHLGLEQLIEMPTDRFPLAVFVRRQVKVFGVFQQPFELADLGRLAGRNDVDRVEVVVDVHPQVGPLLLLIFLGDLLGPLRQVADVPNAGLDREIAAEEFADRPGLGRRFDDHQRLAVAS